MSTNAPSIGGAAPTRLAECPYKGLQPYDEGDEDYYFGRDADRDLVIANLMASRLTILYGPSGVGKSSLLRAGVVRLLRSMPRTSFSYLAVGNAVVVYFASWRQRPLDAIGDALRAAIPEKLATSAYAPPPGPLSVDLLRDITEDLDADVYLILDQFEEEPLYADPESAEHFASEIGRIVGSQSLRASILVAVREDALAKLDRFEGHVPGLFENKLRLEHLDEPSARAAIEQPLERFNAGKPEDERVTIEPALVDELLIQLRTGRLSVSDTGQGSRDRDTVTIETPFLQLVMTRLWSDEQARGSHLLRLSTLSELGDAERIVRTHLDTVMAELTDEQRLVAATIFRYLVTPSGMKIAHTAEDLAEYAGLDDARKLIPVLEELSSGRERILRPVEPSLDRPSSARYEIFHDVLGPAVLDWRRRYVADEARAESERALLARQHDEEQHHRETRRRLRRARLVVAALAVLLLATIASGLAARRMGDEANASAKLSQSGEYLSQSRQLLSSNPASALAWARKAYDLTASPAAMAAIREAYDADRERMVVRAGKGSANIARFSPNGKLFVTGSTDGTVRLFDGDTGRLVRELPVAKGNVYTAEFSPDGSMLAVTTSIPDATVYDVKSGRSLLAVDDYDYYMQTDWGVIAGEPVLITGGYGHEARAWRPRSGALAVSYTAAGASSPILDVSRDSTKVAVASTDSLSVLDARSGKLLKQSKLDGEAGALALVGANAGRLAVWVRPQGEFFWRLVFWDWAAASLPNEGSVVSRTYPAEIKVSRDGDLVATVYDKQVGIFDAASGDFLQELQQPDLLSAVDFSPDGSYVVTGGLGGRVSVWRWHSSEPAPFMTMLGHGGLVRAVTFSPNRAGFILSAGDDGTVRLWQAPADSTIATVYNWMQTADVTPDGRSVVSVSEQGYLNVWDRDTGTARDRQRATADESKGVYYRVRWLPDDRRVALSADGDWAPVMRDLSANDVSDPLEQNDVATYGLAVSPSGNLLAMGDGHDRVVLWNTASGKIERKLIGGDPKDAVVDVAFVPGSDLVAGASRDGTVRLWKASAGGAPVGTIGTVGSFPLSNLAVSKDGRWLASVSVDHVVRVYTTTEGRLVQQLQGPSSVIGDVTFSPDASKVAVAAGDGRVYVWGRATGELMGTMQRHSGAVNSVEFTRGGKQLVTASDDGTAAMFDCTVCLDDTEVLPKVQARLDARATGAAVPLDGASDRGVTPT